MFIFTFIFLLLLTCCISSLVILLKRTKGIIKFLGCLFLTGFGFLMLILFIISCILSFHESYDFKEFNQNKWMTEKDKRYEMTYTLINKKLILKKNKEEIEALLGKTSYCTPNYLRYYIGSKSGFINMYENYIEIHLKHDKAYKVVQHY